MQVVEDKTREEVIEKAQDGIVKAASPIKQCQFFAFEETTSANVRQQDDFSKPSAEFVNQIDLSGQEESPIAIGVSPSFNASDDLFIDQEDQFMKQKK